MDRTISLWKWFFPLRKIMDAYLQVLSDNYKSRFVLSNFRKIYPKSKITLISDSGDDLSELADKYKCEYFYRNLKTGNSPYGFTKEQTIEWLDRFYLSFENSKSRNLIYLEDDVLVRKEINIDFDFNLMGLHVNNIPHEIIYFFEKKYNLLFKKNVYGACGGAIYNVNYFLKNFIFFKKLIEDDFDDIKKSTGHNFGYLDMFMPVLYMVSGSDYHENIFMTETHRNNNWLNSNKNIIHGKNIYTI